MEEAPFRSTGQTPKIQLKGEADMLCFPTGGVRGVQEEQDYDAWHGGQPILGL